MPQVSTRRPSPFRSAAIRARWTVWLLLANVVAAVTGVATSVWGKTLVGDFERGAASVEDLDRFDSAFALGGVVQTAVFVLTAIAWLAWSSRTVDNEDALGIGPSSITPGWAIGWWFVPLANLVMPYRIHREIHDRYHGVKTGAGIVALWWLAYIGGSIFTNVIGGVWMEAETFPELQTALTLWVISDVSTAVTAILAIVLVQKIQRRADVRAAMQAAAAAEPPGPLPIEPGTTTTTTPPAGPVSVSDAPTANEEG